MLPVDVITDEQVMEFVASYMWPLFRIAAMLMAMPLIGARIVSARVRTALAFTITAIVAPLLPPVPVMDLISIQSLIVTFHQVMIGVAMGLSLQIFFQIFILTGQIIAGKLGLGFASMNDPSSGVSVPLISQFYSITVTLLFFAVNGHIVAIEALIGSFYSLPIGQVGIDTKAMGLLLGMGSWMFSGAVLIALPLLTALLVVNLAFGVMSRAAPQMNVSAVGFPITLVFGLFLMWAGLESFLPNFMVFSNEAFQFLHSLVGNP